MNAHTPSINQHKRPLNGRRVSKRDGEPTKKRKLEDALRSWPRLSEVRESKSSIAIAPNWGSELFTWLREHDKTSDIEDSDDSDDGSRSGSHLAGGFHGADLEVDASRALEPLESSTRRLSLESSGMPDAAAHQLRHASGSSSNVSSSDPVFTPTTARCQSDSSVAADGSDDVGVPSGPNGGYAQTRDLRNQKEAFATAGTELADPSPVEVLRKPHHGSLSYDLSGSLPYGYPTSWDQAHPADKMIVCMRAEDHSWREIEQRWRDMTGKNDNRGYLESRYRRLKKKTGLLTDEDLERVLIAEATARSESNNRGGSSAGLDKEGKPECKLRREKNGRFKSSNPKLGEGTRAKVLPPKSIPSQQTQLDESEDETSEHPLNMVFEAKPIPLKHRVGGKAREPKMISSSVKEAEMPIRERCENIAQQPSTCNHPDDGGSLGPGTLNRTESALLGHARRRTSRSRGHNSDTKSRNVNGESGQLSEPDDLSQESATSVFDATGPSRTMPSEPKGASHYVETGKPTKWVRIQLPSRKSLAVVSSREVLEEVSPNTGNIQGDGSEPQSCHKNEIGNGAVKRPLQMSTSLQLNEPRSLWRPREPKSSPPRRNSRSLDPAAFILAPCRADLQPHSGRSAVEGETVDPVSAPFDSAVGVDHQDAKTAERRLRLSLASKAAWAERRAEGRDGRFGGLPGLGTIMRTENRAKRTREMR